MAFSLREADRDHRNPVHVHAIFGLANGVNNLADFVNIARYFRPAEERQAFASPWRNVHRLCINSMSDASR